MSDETVKPETHSDRAWAFLMSWTGRVTAIVGLCATFAGGVTWLVAHHRQQRERSAQLQLAQIQSTQGDYEASIATYASVLASDPLDRTALDGQLNTAMLWTENFSVLVPEGQTATDLAGHMLDQMMAVLEAGLTRSHGVQAADVQAHLGWAHWLNQHIAAREFGSAAEQNLRAALAADPRNPYANAMLGNWMLQSGGDFSEAVRHFHTAVDSARAMPFVRRLQIGGLTSYDHPGARRELIRAASEMRLRGDSLDPDQRRRAFGFCCDIVVTNRTELAESLSALPAKDAWQTYLWLENAPSDPSPNSPQALTHDYIQASLLEISGNRQQALVQYRIVQQRLRALPNMVLSDWVNAAVQRLSHQGHTG